ncbi:hypothetical protein KMW28_23560 [Flammeovirga yaeyamensis]|uniref:Uncharacterized protein n=1 Tax=Flammeovirga yaeyamensis TaxID=367791 RepID=A0AAX1NCS7_9BACT|nr:hypothetical protein [Flammeovirga yaeyamensis]MBB3696650.1 hypothetical protein [Flammeovirga yaeyamensis]NMF33323.1 hypothetical protein [Flammeovirga yaeyamensis]QWG05400.1 hypothetical protein KMW28_23560 [Flammeovirga yaeyamensis]
MKLAKYLFRPNALFYVYIVLALLAIGFSSKAQDDFKTNTGYVSTKTSFIDFNTEEIKKLHPNSMVILTNENGVCHLSFLCIDPETDKTIEGKYEIVLSKSKYFNYEFEPAKVGDPKVNIFIPNGKDTWEVIVTFFDGTLIDMGGIREITPDEHKILASGKSPFLN